MRYGPRSAVSIGMLLCLVLTWAPRLRAQAEVFLEVRRSELTQVPLIVEDFTAGSVLGLPLGAVRDESGQLLEDALAQDLLYTDAFRVIREHRGDPVQSGSHTDLRGRSVAGPIQARARGSVAPVPGGVLLSAALVDEGSGNVIFERGYGLQLDARSGAADTWVIHQLADDITLHLTGTRGCAATRIAFVRGGPNGKELYLIDWDGTHLEPVTALRSILLSPAWFPAGTRVAFTSYLHGVPELVEFDLASRRVESICAARTPGAPAYSPDGKRIAFSTTQEGNAEIYVARADGSDARRLTFHPGIDTSPSWSPSGERLVFTSDRCGKPQLFVMDSDGANLTQLTFEGDWNDSPDWSPRADRIVHVALIEKRFELALIRTDGSGWQRLTVGGGCENPSWAPDGRHVVFARSQGGVRQLWVVDADSGIVRRLTPSAVEGYDPAWSPPARERVGVAKGTG